jgi:hydroxyethylthiazole kinase-like uncharacterized protein yjeF
MSPVPELTAALLRTMPLPRHRDGDDKEDRGRVLVVAGSAEMPGAALLAGIGALRAGAGKLQFAIAGSVAPHLAVAVPEARVFAMPETRRGGLAAATRRTLVGLASEASAVVLGPGMVDAEAVSGLVRALLDDPDGPPLVLDALALKALPRRAGALARRGGRVVLTPHAGEMAGCLGIDIAAVQAEPLETARRACAALSSVVALKGGCTRIAAPDGRAWTCGRGNVGLATSGSGDTLAGIVAGLLARGAEAATACAWGVYVHGEAGARLAARVGPVGYLAREIAGEVPAILAELDPA